MLFLLLTVLGGLVSSAPYLGEHHPLKVDSRGSCLEEWQSCGSDNDCCAGLSCQPGWPNFCVQSVLVLELELELEDTAALSRARKLHR